MSANEILQDLLMLSKTKTMKIVKAATQTITITLFWPYIIYPGLSYWCQFDSVTFQGRTEHSDLGVAAEILPAVHHFWGRVRACDRSTTSFSVWWTRLLSAWEQHHLRLSCIEANQRRVFPGFAQLLEGKGLPGLSVLWGGVYGQWRRALDCTSFEESFKTNNQSK